MATPYHLCMANSKFLSISRIPPACSDGGNARSGRPVSPSGPQCLARGCRSRPLRSWEGCITSIDCTERRDGFVPCVVFVDEFVRRHHRQRYSRYASPLPRPSVTVVPPNFGSRLIGVRLRLRLTQAELARRIGAANKGVVYQSESGKRTPLAFWTRVEQLAASDGANKLRRAQCPASMSVATQLATRPARCYQAVQHREQWRPVRCGAAAQYVRCRRRLSRVAI